MAAPTHRLEVRVDPEIERYIRDEMEATGLSRSQVVRYALRRAMDAGVSAREAGAKEGFLAAVHEIHNGMNDMLANVKQRLKDNLE